MPENMLYFTESKFVNKKNYHRVRIGGEPADEEQGENQLEQHVHLRGRQLDGDLRVSDRVSFLLILIFI